MERNNEAGRNNVCSKGHQLYPTVKKNTGWRCDECRRKPEKIDPDVCVWRCEHDKRSMSLKTEVRSESVEH